MKQRSASIPLRPLTIALAVSVLLLTIAGRVTYLVGPGSLCHAWPFCAPTNPFEWVKLVHVILGAISAVLMLSVLGRTWTEYRSDRIVLPLTTVTAVLFAGQAFVGAMQVVRGFPEHLVVLHTLTAVSLWISLPARALPAWLKGDPNRQRGEFVWVVHAPEAQAHSADLPLPAQALMQHLVQHLPIKQAAGLVADATGLNRKQLYETALSWRKHDDSSS